MVVRIAENLYWTGRYIKRTMYLAKYLRVQYFSTLDASMALNLNFTMRSILNMYGEEWPENKELNENEVLLKVGFDQDNPSSLVATISAARENTRALRHVLSSEVWESTNVMYHFAKNYSPEYFVERGLYEFTIKIEDHVKIIRSNIHSTMMRTDDYYFLMLGAWIEESSQILRILIAKMFDVEALSQEGQNIPVMQYQWSITLKALESFDMHNKYNQNITSIESVAEFLVNNPKFPRSLYYNISHMIRDIKKISIQPKGYNDFIFYLEKIESDVKFFDYKNKDDFHDFLKDLTDRVSGIHDLCSKLYFNT